MKAWVQCGLMFWIISSRNLRNNNLEEVPVALKELKNLEQLWVVFVGLDNSVIIYRYRLDPVLLSVRAVWFKSKCLLTNECLTVKIRNTESVSIFPETKWAQFFSDSKGFSFCVRYGEPNLIWRLYFQTENLSITL